MCLQVAEGVHREHRPAVHGNRLGALELPQLLWFFSLYIAKDKYYFNIQKWLFLPFSLWAFARFSVTANPVTHTVRHFFHFRVLTGLSELIIAFFVVGAVYVPHYWEQRAPFVNCLLAGAILPVFTHLPPLSFPTAPPPPANSPHAIQRFSAWQPPWPHAELPLVVYIVHPSTQQPLPFF